MKIRVASAAQDQDYTATLAVIFSFTAVELMLFPVEIRSRFEESLIFTQPIYWTLSTNSYVDLRGSKVQLEYIRLTSENPLAVIQPAAGECWDVCLKLLHSVRDTPLYFFIKLKAKERKSDLEMEAEGPRLGSNRLSKPPMEYIHLRTFMFGEDWRNDRGKEDFFYIQMGTDASESYALEHCIILDDVATLRFMGQLEELYKALR